VQGFNRNYSNLFGTEDTEDGEEGETDGGPAEGIDKFAENWGYVRFVDRVSELTRKTWDEVFEMNVYEFFNIIAYAKDKAVAEKESIKAWEKKH